ncbi:MAG TPA: PAS domain-containing protein [Vicinamibacteria bacterium]|nr:PAS domain-containing protein [Vicinamibacteria bacterium]
MHGVVGGAARLVDATATAVVCVDGGDRVTYMNPAASRILRHGRAAVGLPWREARGPALADDDSALGESEDPLARARRVGHSVEGVTIGLEARTPGDQPGWFDVDVGSLSGGDWSTAPAFLILRDVTPRRRLTHLLARSRADHLKLLDSVPDAVLRLDAGSRIRFGNRCAARLFGLRPAQIVGRRCEDLGLTPQLERRIEESVAEVISGGRSVTVDLPVARGRRLREFEALLIPETVAGRVEGVVVIARDITRARSLERRYQTLFESMFDGVYLVEVLRGLDGAIQDVRCLGANPSFLRMVGQEAATFVGHLSRRTLPTDDPWWLEVFDEVERTGVPRYVERRMVTVPLDIETFIYRTGPGRCAAVVRDVSERKRTEAALRESEARLRFMTDNMVDMISVLSPDGRFQYLSPSHRTQLWVDPAALVGAPAATLIDPDVVAGMDTPIQQAIAAGQESVRVTYPYRHPAGGVRWLESIVRLVYDGGSLANVVISTRDITAQHEAEDEARRLQERLRELSARLQTAAEESARNISRRVHDDLGQALTALKTDAVWIRARLDDTQPALRDKAEEMLQLIESTLQSVRSISRELRPLVLEDLGLAAALQWLGAEFARRTGLRCSVDCSSEDLEVPASVGRALFRVAQEALTNVERHARASAVRLTLSLSGSELTMAVADDGRGFEMPARRSERSLGLLSMEERAAAVGGRLTVRTGPGCTRVEVVVPLQGTPDSQQQEKVP